MRFSTEFIENRWSSLCIIPLTNKQTNKLTNADDSIISFSLSVLTAILPGERGLAGFVEAKDDGSGGDNWSYKSCKAPVKSSPPTNQHLTFYRPDALPVTQPTVSKH